MPDHGAPFTAQDVFNVALEKDNSTNTLEHAAKGIGPSKCWFMGNAQIVGLSCRTWFGWMPDWAGKIARKGVYVYGTTGRLRAEWRERAPSSVYIKPYEKNLAYNWRQALSLRPGWQWKEGTA